MKPLDAQIARLAGTELLLVACEDQPGLARALDRLAGLPRTEVVRLSGNPPDVAALELLRRLVGELDEIASRGSGLELETKPASVAFHFRNAPDELADAAIRAILNGPALCDGVSVRHGETSLELSVAGLEPLRTRLGASATVYLGGDEAVIGNLRDDDVAVRLGTGASGRRFLERLADARRLALDSE